MSQNLHADILFTFPAVDESRIDSLLQEELDRSRQKLVVLDDDPTGVQTVHDVSVYTDWSYESIRSGFDEDSRIFFLLTNSRGFTAEQTTAVHIEIAETVHRAAQDCGQDYLLISRSDSVMRGHYPLETRLLKDTIEKNSEQRFDGEILCPFFKEGGRYTIGNIHYVRYGDTLTPAGETEFARDKTFGYRSSDIREYVEEKTAGEFPAAGVTVISLDDLRALRIERITEQLNAVSGFRKVVVNAVDYCDIKVFCIALFRSLAAGKRFLFRTAASLVKVLGGISDRPLLSRSEMVLTENGNGGIIVVGSHTQKTTQQLNTLREIDGLEFIEFNSDLVTDDRLFEEEIRRVLAMEECLINSGKTAVVYTCRRLLSVEGEDPEAALVRSVKISDAVQSLVGRLNAVPAFVVAKGGITSSDVGTKALRVKKAHVLGQIAPGVPVWQTGPESKYPGTAYVIFPGNVGEPGTLKDVVLTLLGR